MVFEKFKIEVYIPYNLTDKVREALNDIGIGKVGNYDNCICVSEVKGVFRPLKGSNPYLGFENALCEVLENKIETICIKNDLKKVIKAIRDVHPYDEPLINVIPILDVDDLISEDKV